MTDALFDELVKEHDFFVLRGNELRESECRLRNEMYRLEDEWFEIRDKIKERLREMEEERHHCRVNATRIGAVLDIYSPVN